MWFLPTKKIIILEKLCMFAHSLDIPKKSSIKRSEEDWETI